MENLILISNDIKSRMKLLKLTQADISKITGLSIRIIGNIVNAKEGTAIKNWIIVANALGANIILSTKKMSDETRKSF